jgi:hypothetical protein
MNAVIQPFNELINGCWLVTGRLELAMNPKRFFHGTFS